MALSPIRGVIITSAFSTIGMISTAVGTKLLRGHSFFNYQLLPANVSVTRTSLISGSAIAVAYSVKIFLENSKMADKLPQYKLVATSGIFAYLISRITNTSLLTAVTSVALGWLGVETVFRIVKSTKNPPTNPLAKGKEID